LQKKHLSQKKKALGPNQIPHQLEVLGKSFAVIQHASPSKVAALLL
jgi:hypothetical protein